MNTAILPALERLLEEGRQEEARALLRRELSAPLSDEERGALLVGFASAYLALTGGLGAERRRVLTEEIGVLEEMNALDKNIGEKVKLARARAALEESSG